MAEDIEGAFRFGIVVVIVVFGFLFCFPSMQLLAEGGNVRNRRGG